jgi:hypothetical protein
MTLSIMTLSTKKLMRVYSSLESSKILMSFILLSVDMLSVIMLGVMMLNADNLLAMLVGVMQSFLFLLLCSVTLWWVPFCSALLY